MRSFIRHASGIPSIYMMMHAHFLFAVVASALSGMIFFLYLTFASLHRMGSGENILRVSSGIGETL